MTDEVTKEIREILDKGQPSKSDQDGAINITVGDITGDNNTVIIGDHPRRRREDREGYDSAHGRRASDHQVRAELRALRDQLTRVKWHLTDLYDTCLKHCPHRRPPCRNSSGANTPAAPSVSNRRTSRHPSDILSTPQRKPAPRLPSRPSITPNFPQYPIHSLVSFPLSPLNESGIHVQI
ncbi:MAG: hypothetical protein JJU06_12445, partial [Ectothiorhodospiraceae bacterium]|nr:hypothetical protein [Ectothiorhodospiraceae bacterium]